MLALGKLLELTLAGREPCEKIQLTPHGVKLHWLAEGAPPAPTSAWICWCPPAFMATNSSPSMCWIA
mgnify:CR=1 FL=1